MKNDDVCVSCGWFAPFAVARALESEWAWLAFLVLVVHARHRASESPATIVVRDFTGAPTVYLACNDRHQVDVVGRDSSTWLVSNDGRPRRVEVTTP